MTAPVIGTCSFCGYLGYLAELPLARRRRVFICEECRAEESPQPLAPLPPAPLPPTVAPEPHRDPPAALPERRPPGREICDPLPLRRQAWKAGA